MRTLLIAIALFCACSKSDAPAAKDELPSMTVDELDQALAAKAAVPVDCNTVRTRQKSGVVPGAILVTDDANYAASELPPDTTTKLVFYCANPG